MNAGREPLFVLDLDCLVLTNRIIKEVEKAGMQTLRSFDLDSLRSSGKAFCCPIHGTRDCTCHLVILLILLQDRGCLTVILEGSDQQTSIYLDAGQGVADEQVEPSLTVALFHAMFPMKFIHQIEAD